VVGAAQAASLTRLEALLKQGGDLNASYRNYRPLHALIQEKPHETGGKPSAERLACLDFLLEHGANPELTGGWPPARAIITAAFMGIPAYVERLQKVGARVDGFAHAALGNVDGVKRALSADPAFANARDAGGLTALQCAAGSRIPGHEAEAAGIAQLLLDAGANPRALTRSWSHEVDATYFAAGAKRTEVYRLILERGGDASNALSHAVWGNQFELAEIALAHGGHPDRSSANGEPLLNDLIRWGRMDGTMWLLGKGASPNLPDGEGWTAVHQAASRGNARMLQAALAAGGDPRRNEKLGHTPLDVAKMHRRAKLIPLLRPHATNWIGSWSTRVAISSYAIEMGAAGWAKTIGPCRR
jgi:ankyrin repeat protein